MKIIQQNLIQKVKKQKIQQLTKKINLKKQLLVRLQQIIVAKQKQRQLQKIKVMKQNHQNLLKLQVQI